MSYYGDSSTHSAINNLKYEVEDFLKEISELETKEDAIVKLMMVVKDSIGGFLYDDLNDTDYF